MNSALSTLVNNFSEINKCNCEEKEDKDIKTRLIKSTGKTIIHTTCKTCKISIQLFILFYLIIIL